MVLVYKRNENEVIVAGFDNLANLLPALQNNKGFISYIITCLIKFAVLCVSDRSAHDAPPHSFFIIIKAAPCLHSIQVAAKVDWQEVAGDRPHCYTPLFYIFIRGQHSCWKKKTLAETTESVLQLRFIKTRKI